MGARSTIRPAYMTAMSSARLATTPRSWVTRITAMWRSRCRSARRSRIWAWTVTSRPVVGSSAITRRGAQARAMAIITRWRMPPDSWWGYQRTRSSGEGMPTERRSSTAVAPASLRSRSRWRRSDSVIWRPTRTTGLRAVIGSWKIMVIWAPHTWRSSAGSRVVISWPANRTEPLRSTSRVGSRPMIDRESTVFPEPDSPTTPRVSPRSKVRETPSTARTVPREVRKAVWRSSTTSRGLAVTSSTSGNWRVEEGPARRRLTACPPGCRTAGGAGRPPG